MEGTIYTKHQKGFQKIGIWSFKPCVVEDKMWPSETFVVANKTQANSIKDEELDADNPLMQEVLGERVLESQP